MKQGLLIIDVQKDYFARGKMELHHPEEALKNTLLLRKYFQEKGLPIFFIQHIKEDLNGGFFIKGTKGAELHDEFLPLKEGEELVIKHYPNSFLGTNLKELATKLDVDQFVICGMMTHMCADSTTRQACEFGYQPILIHDACATKSLLVNDRTVDALDVQAAFIGALSTFAVIKETAAFL